MQKRFCIFDELPLKVNKLLLNDCVEYSHVPAKRALLSTILHQMPLRQAGLVAILFKSQKHLSQHRKGP